MMKRKNNKRGFTIIELTIVVAVIAILSAVLIPTFASVTRKARQSADQTAVRNLNTIIATAEDDITDVDNLIEFLNGKDIAADSYVPMSKNYSFVWNTTDNVVMLYNVKEGKVEFPAEYAEVTEFVILAADKDTDVVETVADAALAASNGGTTAINANLTVPSYINVEKNLTVSLIGNVSNPDSIESRGLFTAGNKATLTLSGNGTVNAAHANNDFSIAVWARGGDVVINGGNYTNVGAKAIDDNGLANNNELVYVTKGGKVTINGGTFKCANPQFTLNSHDTDKGSIVVAGGSFFNFDPSNLPAAVASDDIKLAEGFKVVAEPVEGTSDVWYKVVPDTNA